MRDRLLFGPLLIVALIGLVWADEALAGRTIGSAGALPRGLIIFPVTVMVAFFGTRELAVMIRLKSVAAFDGVLFVGALLGLLASAAPLLLDGRVDWSKAPSEATVPMSGVLALCYSMFRYSRGKNTQGVIAATGASMLAFVYLGLMFGFVFLLRAKFSAWVLLWVLMVTKSCDIGAYFTGKAIGRTKLIPWLSPGKTWEGLVGGLVFASAIGAGGVLLLQGRVAGPLPPVWAGSVAGAMFAVVGQLGDLMKSLLKRDAGLKDSSHLFPGLGGMLDVIDSPLVVMPVAYWWLRATAIGVQGLS